MVERRLLSAILLSPLLAAGEKPAKPGPAVISGTVFREPGFALGGAEIELQPDPDSATSKKKKIKAMKAQSDGRGEFSFRVPAEPMRYIVRVRASGYTEEKKTVAIQGEQRQDVFVTLKAAAKEASQ